MPRAFILAGPNGAGKTTFAHAFLPEGAGILTFINADLIAAGLSPFRPEDASVLAMRLMAQRMHDVVETREDFAIETTLAGRSYASLIRGWQRTGYRVKIIFLRLPSAELAIERVRQRVSLGGHHVPDAIVHRRFRQGWDNFQHLYRPLADAWAVYDSSGPIPFLIDDGVRS